MKEDILEQIVEDYLQFKGFFTIHNVKFKPDKTAPGYRTKQDAVASDIDVVGFHPMQRGADRTWVVSCKSWGEGFDPKKHIDLIRKNKRIAGRPAWKSFRELARKKWANALIKEIRKLTGSGKFTHITAVTRLRSDESIWREYSPFRANLKGNPIKILTLEVMLSELYEKTNTTVASSEVGRLLQVIKASGWKP
ncbi:MAG TPA: hypothetical protein VFI75_04550 [Candidatus Acidoferrum sp.]|nr:hypothetical protein [Candidatus Acidoferrum sp.]